MKKVESNVFYIGTNDADDLTAIRRYLLTSLPSLPIAGEYIHRDAYLIGESTEKTRSYLLKNLAQPMFQKAFAMKDKVDGF